MTGISTKCPVLVPSSNLISDPVFFFSQSLDSEPATNYVPWILHCHSARSFPGRSSGLCRATPLFLSGGGVLAGRQGRAEVRRRYSPRRGRLYQTPRR